MESQILINEVYPNPELGSEWIELQLFDENEDINLENFTIFDSTRQIYKFSNEQFVNQLLVVEVSGLNNDADSVILKNELDNILDSFTYDQSEKGLSWSRENNSDAFALTIPSRNLENPYISPTPTLTPTLTITPSTPTPISTLTPAASQKPNNIPTIPLEIRSEQSTANNKQIFKEYDLSKIKLNSIDQEIQKRQLRLVFIGEQLGQAEVMNVIIGSFLIILSASFLLYVKIKNKHL